MLLTLPMLVSKSLRPFFVKLFLSGQGFAWPLLTMVLTALLTLLCTFALHTNRVSVSLLGSLNTCVTC